ncbi:hypothetical protein Tco_0524128 [Tanacetum coccineum]
MGFKASSSWFLASKGFVLSSTSARAWLGLRFKVEKSCEDEMKGYKGSLEWWKKEKRVWLPKVMTSLWEYCLEAACASEVIGKLSSQPTTRTIANVDGTSTSMIPCSVTTKEKSQKKNDVKKVALNCWHLKVKTSSEDLNLKFLRSPLSEWNTHIDEKDVKRTVTSSSNSNSSSQNMALCSSPSNTMKLYIEMFKIVISMNGSDTTGYETSPSSRRTVGFVEEIFSSKAMVAIDGATQRILRSCFMDQIAVLKRVTSFKDSKINALKSEIEKLKKEKESNQIKIDKFKNASKSLDKLIWSQISDNSRKGVPTTPKFEGYEIKASKSVCKDTSNEVKKTPDAPLGEKLVSEKEKQTIFPTKIESVKQQEKPARKLVKYAEMYRSQNLWGIKETGIIINSLPARRCFAHHKYHKKWTPRAVLMKTGLKPLNTVRPVNIVHPKTTVYSSRSMSCFSKLAQSTVKMPYQSRTALTNKNFNQKVNTAKEKVYTTKPKAVNTARQTLAVVNALKAN